MQVFHLALQVPLLLPLVCYFIRQLLYFLFEFLGLPLTHIGSHGTFPFSLVQALVKILDLLRQAVDDTPVVLPLADQHLHSLLHVLGAGTDQLETALARATGARGAACRLRRLVRWIGGRVVLLRHEGVVDRCLVPVSVVHQLTPRDARSVRGLFRLLPLLSRLRSSQCR